MTMPTSPFTKPSTTYDQQVAILRQRGMHVDDEESAKFYLQHLNYYRLSERILTPILVLLTGFLADFSIFSDSAFRVIALIENALFGQHLNLSKRAWKTPFLQVCGG